MDAKKIVRKEVDQVIGLLPETIKQVFLKETEKYGKPEELRFRIGKPLIIVFDTGEKVYPSYIISSRDMKELSSKLCEYSAYAYEEEMKQGFITIAGGHRAGIAGQVITENGKVKNIRHIACINLRIAAQIKGCADDILEWMLDNERVFHTLIISPPGVGKTTLLRDIIRQFSNGFALIHGKNVGVVDERSEICACFRGVPQNDVGIRTDVLDMCPKAEGMMRLVRSMAPDIIAVDEIGTWEDLQAVRYVLNCGCSVIATLHGSSIPETMLDENLFERYIILENKQSAVNITEKKHTVRKKNVYDRKGCMIAAC